MTKGTDGAGNTVNEETWLDYISRPKTELPLRYEQVTAALLCTSEHPSELWKACDVSMFTYLDVIVPVGEAEE